MTNEEKQLLLKDICARLPYGVKVNFRSNIEVLCEVHIYQSVQTIVGERGILYDVDMPNVKPYLRPMSSMIEEEENEFLQINFTGSDNDIYGKLFNVPYADEVINWLNAHHFDYRCLIEKGLAIEAPEGMYK